MSLEYAAGSSCIARIPVDNAESPAPVPLLVPEGAGGMAAKGKDMGVRSRHPGCLHSALHWLCECKHTRLL